MAKSSILATYEDGELTPHQALRTLLSDLAETQDELKALERERDAIRAQIQQIVERNGAFHIEGLGKASVIPGGTRESYNPKEMATVVARLVKEGQLEIAERIMKCQKYTEVKASLRIELEGRK